MEDKYIATGSDQTIECLIKDLSAYADVVWISPDNSTISVDGNSNYTVNQGLASFANGIQTATLTIAQPVLATLVGPSVYTCAVTSRTKLHSPTVNTDITLTPLILGLEFLCTFKHWFSIYTFYGQFPSSINFGFGICFTFIQITDFTLTLLPFGVEIMTYTFLDTLYLIFQNNFRHLYITIEC